MWLVHRTASLALPKLKRLSAMPVSTATSFKTLRHVSSVRTAAKVASVQALSTATNCRSACILIDSLDHRKPVCLDVQAATKTETATGVNHSTCRRMLLVVKPRHTLRNISSSHASSAKTDTACFAASINSVPNSAATVSPSSAMTSSSNASLVLEVASPVSLVANSAATAKKALRSVN